MSKSQLGTSIKNVADSIKTAFMQNTTIHVNTITYKGLFGAASITDPAGRKTVYAYDSAGYVFASCSGVVTSRSNLTKGLKTYEKIRILNRLRLKAI